MTSLNCDGLPASCCRLEGRADPPVAGGVDGRAGRHDLVDAVQHVAGKLDVGGGQLGLQMLHRPRADDHRSHRGVAEDERDRAADAVEMMRT
jgi:hypothetical protein